MQFISLRLQAASLIEAAPAPDAPLTAKPDQDAIHLGVRRGWAVVTVD